MFWPNATSLENFYASPVGKAALQHIRRTLRQFWSEVKGETVAGLGFTTPYLQDFNKNGNHLISLMPGAQGCFSHGPESAAMCLVDEAQLPLADNSVDRLLLLHVLEYSDQSAAMMRELWRVLTPSGKLLIAMPNRLGLWSHVEKTPFGHGHPFNILQITNLLKTTMFTPLRSTSTLFAPPSSLDFFTRSDFLEKFGHRCLQPFGGVLITEAEKQLYAGLPVKEATLSEKLRTYVMPPVAGEVATEAPCAYTSTNRRSS